MTVMFSGGAAGGDMFWDSIAHRLGHDRVHFSFEGHRTKADPKTVHILDQTQLKAARTFLEEANKTLGRSIPWRTSIYNLLARNYYQVECTRSVYAIAPIDDSGLVEGGTAWAVQMYLERVKDHSFGSPGFIPAYVFDLRSMSWKWWVNGWSDGHGVPPCPGRDGDWTGIGSRNIPADLEKDERFGAELMYGQG